MAAGSHLVAPAVPNPPPRLVAAELGEPRGNVPRPFALARFVAASVFRRGRIHFRAFLVDVGARVEPAFTPPVARCHPPAGEPGVWRGLDCLVASFPRLSWPVMAAGEDGELHVKVGMQGGFGRSPRHSS